MMKVIPAAGGLLVASPTPCSLWWSLGETAQTQSVCPWECSHTIPTACPLVPSCLLFSTFCHWPMSIQGEGSPAQCSLYWGASGNSSRSLRWWGWRYLENASWDISCSPVPSSLPNSIQFQENRVDGEWVSVESKQIWKILFQSKLPGLTFWMFQIFWTRHSEN